MTATTHTARETWLMDAVERLTPLFAAQGATVPAVKVSVGWPGGPGKKNSVIGQCWSASAAEDGASHIFISPVLSDAPRVLDVLMHELVHAADGLKSGHKGGFAKLAKALGLTGKMTATVASPELAETLKAMAEELGEYPHGALRATPDDGAEGPKKQTTRMIKAECPKGSGYKVRLTRQWLDDFGAPYCPHCSEQMEEAL